MKVLFLFFTDPPRPFSSAVAALSAVVRAAGHETSAVEIARRNTIDEVAKTVVEADADLIAISAMSRDWPGAHALLRKIGDATDAFVVVGGYHASMAPRDVASCPRVDAVCVGEGERPVGALLDVLASGRPSTSLPGLWIRTEGVFAEPPPDARPEPDIAALPWWDYDVFGDVRQSLAEGINTFGPHVDRFLPTRAGRGCPFSCAYCSAPQWNQLGGLSRPHMRNTRPVSDLCDELASLRDRYEPEGFEFWDEHFPVSVEWLRELARDYPRRVGLPFKVEMHPNAATRERLALLAEAGCVLFHCGVEAGDEELRRNVLNRRTRNGRLQQVFEDARELGLETSASLMTSLPTESRAQALSTVDLLRRLRPDSFMWSTYQALPGTVLGEASVARWPGPARDRFDDYDALVLREPPSMTEADRGETFRALGELQDELVADASARSRGKPRKRPVEIPVGPRPAPPRLAEMLGLLPSDAALSESVRLNSAVRDGEQLTLELEARDLPPQEVQIRPLDGSRYYIATRFLGVSYRGREAPARLLETLQAIAARIEGMQLTELQRIIQ